jgi:DNA sulfur modification protein DndE
VFRDVHIKNVTCESAASAIVVRGLPEQSIQKVVLDDLDIKSVEGISCFDAVDLTLKNVTVHAQKEPVFSAVNVTGLQAVNLTLEKSETEVV